MTVMYIKHGKIQDLYIKQDLLCGLVVRGPGSIPGATSISEK
jgi:hypothetical protein